MVFQNRPRGQKSQCTCKQQFYELNTGKQLVPPSYAKSAAKTILWCPSVMYIVKAQMIFTYWRKMMQLQHNFRTISVTLTQLGLGLGLTTPFNRKLTKFFRTMMYGKNSPRNTGGMFVQFTNILLVLLSMFLHKTETSYKCHLSW